MYNIFIFPISILVFFVGINLILYRYEFYNKMDLGKRNLLSLFISIMLFLIIYNIFIFTLNSLHNKLLIKGVIISLCAIIVMLLCLFIGYGFSKVLNMKYE